MKAKVKASKPASFQVIELEKPIPKLSREDNSNIASLATHPGFHALVGRLRLQRSMLQSALCNLPLNSLQDVYQLQAGIKWITWLDKQVTKAAGKSGESPRDALELEEREFRRMAEALQLVGKESIAT